MNGARQLLSHDAPNVANQSRAVRFAPQATGQDYATNQEAAATLGAEAVLRYQQPAAQAGVDLYGEVDQNVARRAMQKLAAKADMLQVLFILSADEEPAPASSATSPATSPPADDPVR